MQLFNPRRLPRFTLSDSDIQALGSGQVVVCDGFLGAACAAAATLEVAEFLDDLRPGGMGRAAARWYAAAERGDEMTWLDENSLGPALRHYWDQLETVQQVLNQRAYLGLRSFDVQLAQYRTPGAYYARHADAFQVRARRRMTLIYYLNPDWKPDDGGVLRAYAGDGVRDIEPVFDRAVLFLAAEVEHEVLPCHRTRTALTAWFYGPDAVL